MNRSNESTAQSADCDPRVWRNFKAAMVLAAITVGMTVSVPLLKDHFYTPTPVTPTQDIAANDPSLSDKLVALYEASP